MKKAYLNWSSGKDAAYSLYKLQQQGDFDVVELFTLINTDVNRISMHGGRLELLQAQSTHKHMHPHKGGIAARASNWLLATNWSNIIAFCIFRLRERKLLK